MNRLSKAINNSFELFFGRSPKQQMATFPLGGNITWSGESAYYPMEERAFKTLANHFSKIKIQYYYDDESKEYKDVDTNLSKLLKEYPNKYQTPTQFWYSFFYMLFKYNYSVILPTIETTKTKAKGVEQIQREYTSLDVLDMNTFAIARTEHKNEEMIIIKNLLEDESYKIIRYEDVIIQRNNPESFYNGEISNIFKNDIPRIVDKSLSVLLDELNSNFEINGVVSIGNASLGTMNNAMVDNEAKKQKQQEIMDRVKNKLIVLDAGETFTPIQTNFKKNTIQDIEELQNMYYKWYGIPKSIIDLTYTQEEFQPFMNSTIIPKIEDLEYELNKKLLTKNERGHKQKISITYTAIDTFSTKEFVSFTANGIYNGYINKNYVLRAIGEKPTVGGDVYTGNRNMADMNGELPKTAQGKNENQ